MKSFICLLFFIVFYFGGYTQSLNGVWKANFERSVWIFNPVNSVVEFNIVNDSIINGVIHDYFTKGRFSHTSIKGIFQSRDSLFIIEETEKINHNIESKLYYTCFGKMHLRLTREGNSWFLRGKWKDMDTRLFHCPTLNVVWQKEIEAGKDTITSAINSKRASVVQKVIELNRDETDSIKIALYDDGVVDGDTATLYFNDSLIVNKLRLSAQPFIFYLSLDKSRQFQKVHLVADNLGSIPPNTALLIITTKRKRYEIRLSSDDHQNGSVEFFLKE